MRQLKYDFLLVAIVLSWGICFPLTKSALFYMDAMPFLFFRFLLGALLLWAIILFQHRKKSDFLQLKEKALSPICLRGGLITGLFGGFGMVLQSQALVYTTASNVAFITGLQVLLVPILGFFFFRRKFEKLSVLGLLGAMVGLLIFCEVLTYSTGGFSFALTSLNFGDILVLCGSLFFGFQLNFNNSYNHRCDVLCLAAWQVTFIGLTGLFTWIFITPHAYLSTPSFSFILELLFNGLVGAGLAFFVMIYVQSKISATHAAVYYSLEPVFGALAAAVIPDITGAVEHLRTPHLIGGTVVLCSIMTVEIIRAVKPSYAEG